MLRNLISQLLAKSLRRPPHPAALPADAGTEDLRAAVDHHQRGRNSRAESICLAMLERNPGDVDTLHFLGNLYVTQERFDEGLPLLARAAALSPGSQEIRWHRGLAFYKQGRHLEAAHVLRGIAAGRPDILDTLLQVKDALVADDHLDEAEACCRRLIELADGAARAKACSDLGTVLLKLGRVEEAIASYRSALDLDRKAVKAHSNLLYAMHYHPAYTPEQIFAEHRRWAQSHATGIARHAHARPGDHGALRAIRVGYVSPDFCNHPVCDYIEPVLRRHDRSRFEVYCYSDVLRPDQYTERLQALDINWRDSASLSDAALAERVLEDRVDILVDLAGHTRGNRLLMFARKPAPVQVTWIGYPGTTGLTEMDYRITDALADPPGTTDPHYSETLMRLPGICVAFRPPDEAPEVNAVPALTRGFVTFGSFNALQKISPEVIALWARILVRQPTSRLLMLSVPEGRARARLRDAFAVHGVGPERLDLRGRLTFRDFLRAYQEVDVALDPFPYAGGSTSLLSLWMGVPVITLAGSSHVSRAGVTILSSAGLDQFVANDTEHYVALATAMAGSPEDLAPLRAAMRARMRASPSMDESRFVRGLEQAYQDMWHAYCAGQQVEQSLQRDTLQSQELRPG